jgi:hypothetical protein
VRPPQPPAAAPDEGRLIERASEGAAVRLFLESEQVQAFMANAEANMVNAMTSLPLDDDAGRRNLAVAIQSHRQMLRYLTELARDGRAAEAELQRLQRGVKPYF